MAHGTVLAAVTAAAIGGTVAIASAVTAAAPDATGAPPASPEPATTPRAPQPAGSSFPWSNLITAVSSVAAGLGGILLRDWLDTRREAGQRQRDAYAALLVSLDELARVIEAPLTPGGELKAGTLTQGIAQAVKTVQRSYFAVYIDGSASVQAVAGKACQAAWDIHNWVTTGQREQGGPATGQLEELREKLTAAGTAFADAVRAETAS